MTFDEMLKGFENTLTDSELIELYEDIGLTLCINDSKSREKERARREKDVIRRKASFLLSNGMTRKRVIEKTGLSYSVVSAIAGNIDSKRGRRYRDELERKQVEEKLAKDKERAVLIASYYAMEEGEILTVETARLGKGIKSIVKPNGINLVRYDAWAFNGDWLTLIIDVERVIDRGDDVFWNILEKDRQADLKILNNA